VWALFAAAMLEQLGFRQLLALWGLAGMLAFCLKLPVRGRRRGIMGPFEPPYDPLMRRRMRAH
jgi:hypothetical protein